MKQIKIKKQCYKILLSVIIFFNLLSETSLAQAACYNIVGYFPSWSGAASAIDYSKYTHIVYSFGIPNADGSIGNIDNSSKLIELVKLGHAQNVKILLSIGGWLTSSPSNTPFESFTDEVRISRFVNACASLITQYNLDGIDLDWEYPTNKTKWNNLIVPLSEKIHGMNKLLGAAVSESANNNGDNYDNVSELDLVNVMCYGSMSLATSAMTYWTSRKVVKSKIMLGVPFFDADNNTAEHIQKANLAISKAGGIMIWDISMPGDINAIYNALGEVCMADQRSTRINVISPKYGTSYITPAIIEINVTASDSDGVAKVEFYNGTFLLGEVTAPPYKYTWADVPIGSYTIYIKATDSLGNIATSFIVANVQGEGPYKNTMAVIPGKIEAENYDYGGQGIGYNDNDAGNNGGYYRLNDGVDIEKCSDTGSGYNIGYINPNEWMKYTINVTTEGSYVIEARVAATVAGKKFHIVLDGVDISGIVTVPNTGGWQIWKTVSVPVNNITAGIKVMKIVFNTDGINLNYINFIQNTVSINDLGIDQQICVFPNPSTGMVTISIEKPWHVNTNILIIDNSGKLTKSVPYNQLLNKREVKVDFSNYPKGIYYVKFNNNYTHTRKVVIQ